MDASLGITKGWWLSYPRVFLFVVPPNEIFVHIKLASGEDCFGFNVGEIAQGLTAAGPFPQAPGDIILNAQVGGLTVREEAGVLIPGAARAIDFIFSLPFGAEIRMPVKIAPIAGSA